MTTILEIITDAMLDIGAIAVEETPTAAESAGALRALNNLIDQWGTESLMVWNTAPNVFNLVGGQQVYTIGTGGNFNVPRPVEIPYAANRDVNGYDYPIVVTTNFQQYAEIAAKTIESSLISIIYDDGNIPLKNLYMWPIPQDTTYTLVLWLWAAVGSFTSLVDTVTLPPGYKRAMQKNLALELCPAYGATPSEVLSRHAVESKAQIQRVNTEINAMNFHASLPQRGPGYSLQDFYTGV